MITLHLLTIASFLSFFLFCSKTSQKKLLNFLFPACVLPFSLKFAPLRPSSLYIAKMGLVNVFTNFYQVKSKGQHPVLILSDQSAASDIVDDFLMLFLHLASKILLYLPGFPPGYAFYYWLFLTRIIY